MLTEESTHTDWPGITVAICARNAAKTINACLTSLLKMDYPSDKLNILVVDNASTDNTSNIVSAYPVKIVCEEKIGRGYARNTAWKNCDTELIAFTDADCRVSKQWLRELVPVFKDENTDIAGGDIITPGDDPLARFFEMRQIVSNREFSGDYPYSPPFLATANAIFRVRAIKAAGGFKTHYRVAEDADICWRIQRNGGTLKYISSGIVYHEHRTTKEALFRQALDYGFDGVSVWLEFHPETRIWIWYGLYFKWIMSLLKIPLLVGYKNTELRQLPILDCIRYSGLAIGRIQAGFKHRRCII